MWPLPNMGPIPAQAPGMPALVTLSLLQAAVKQVLSLKKQWPLRSQGQGPRQPRGMVPGSLH